MRSLLLLNLESQLTIMELPHYNTLNTIYKKNRKSSNKLILVKIITTNYVKWFGGDLMPNRVVKMLYNLVNLEVFIKKSMILMVNICINEINIIIK